VIVPQQTRLVDPFSDISSQAVNQRLKALIPSGKACINGLLVSVNGLNITVSSGIAVKDWVVINIPTDVVFTLDSTITDANLYVVLEYQYALANPAPTATIGYIDVANYDPALHLIIANLTVTHGVIAVSYTDRDVNPILQRISDNLNQNGFNSDLDMNQHIITNLGNDTTPESAVNKQYVDTLSGKVKVDSADTPDYLDQKVVAGTGVTLTVNGTTNKSLEISAPITNEMKVTLADSGISVLES